MIKLIPVISSQDIRNRVEEIAAQISIDYMDKDLVLVGILKGSFIFLSDLTRAITIDHAIDLVGTSSYIGTDTTGIIEFTKKLDIDISGRHILLIEDIVDTGNTLAALIQYFISLHPASIKICTLIDKKERRELTVTVDYACFTIEKGFIVGYGLDYNEKYRNLPAIFDLKFEDTSTA
ncbi:MAG: hypoxanthine phosphoribosyltransferase [Desulfamplus sp.]|nr:hypoxanthine phosphoribosyltransferase [Desulfamplus sp.]